MKQLENEYTAHNRVYKLVKRTDKVAMFKSDDGVVEVFKIKVLPAAEIYGKEYPERESTPSDEDFGKIAFCYTSNYDKAELKYKQLCDEQGV